MPLGGSQEHAAVRNAQLNLARERAILDDQEQEVVHELSNAVGEVDRAYSVAQTAYNRRIAARTEVSATKAAFESNQVPLDLLLDAQRRRQADADSNFFGSLVEYALAVKNLHYTKGSLLDYNEIYLSEGPWPDKAYSDAAKLKTKKHELLDYRIKPAPISAGPIPQPAGLGLPFGAPPGDAEMVPPGGEVRPLPPSNGPTSPPPTQGPTVPPPNIPPVAPERSVVPPAFAPPPASLPPASPPPVSPSPVSPSPVSPPPVAPPQPLPPASSIEFSPPTSRQQPDLMPHNDRALSPAVQPAKSRPGAMDELVASQPPPAALVTAIPPTAHPPIVTTTANIPAVHTAEPSASTLSIYSRGTKPTAPVATEPPSSPFNSSPFNSPPYNSSPVNSSSAASQIRVVTPLQPPGNVQASRSGDTPKASELKLTTPTIRPATATDSNTALRATWPESTIQSFPPIGRGDGASPIAPAPVGTSIWTRGSAQTVSYPATIASPSFRQEPLPKIPPPQSAVPQPAVPRFTVPNAAPQDPSPAATLQPLPPMNGDQHWAAAPQTSTLRIAEPQPPVRVSRACSEQRPPAATAVREESREEATLFCWRYRGQRQFLQAIQER